MLLAVFMYQRGGKVENTIVKANDLRPLRRMNVTCSKKYEHFAGNSCCTFFFKMIDTLSIIYKILCNCIQKWAILCCMFRITMHNFAGGWGGGGDFVLQCQQQIVPPVMSFLHRLHTLDSAQNKPKCRGHNWTIKFKSKVFS